MPSIKLLKDTVINQIAAGEVVERPSSVVRELIDNSADADATEITVTLVEGGHTSILVTDNGRGMGRDDAHLAFERNATSKITSITELQSLQTMGFRGEALASIAAVARVRLRTRDGESPIGTEIFVAGGTIQSVNSVQAPLGTELEIRNLFFNTPARRKFLKSPRYEEARIKDWIIQVSLTQPSIRYRLICDGKEMLNIAPARTLRERAQSVFKRASIPFTGSYDEVEVEGLIGHPSLAGGDSNAFVILVNGRVVHDRAILRAVKDGFSSALKDREFPIGCIQITVPRPFVDINVNPQKSEVRFISSQKVYSAARMAISEAIKEFRAPMVADAGMKSGDTFPGTVHNVFENRYSAAPLRYQVTAQQNLFGAEMQDGRLTAAPFRFSELRYIGQLLTCYLLCELDEQLVVIDMHAAHERINFNKIRNALLLKQTRSQMLLVPETLTLSHSAITHLEAQRDMLERLGFCFEIDKEDLIVSAIPSMIKTSDVASIFLSLADLHIESISDAPFMEKIDMIASRIACHASIRSGDKLMREEVYALFDQLDGAECSAACPHGRPCVIAFDEKSIEQWFGRDR